jgi:HTH-type transcriptional regulator / antitoxin HigA
VSPGEYIRQELKRRGWGQADLALIMSRPAQRINELVLGKASVSPEVAVELAAALGGTAEEWLQREAAYRLSLANTDPENVRRRARLYDLVPVKELQKRGWIRPTDDIDEIEKDVLRFLEISSINEEPCIQAVLRTTNPGAELTPAQRAWCFRVRHMARSITVPPYQDNRADQCSARLRKLAAYSQHVGKVPALFASFGVRFVIVEPLTGTKIDGMATWLDDHSPVVGLSMRFDRIDSFWHTVSHEWSHIRHRDALSVDTDIAEPGEVSLAVKPPVERRADEEAAATLIDPEELQSFIQRVGPFYSKERINQFANRIRMHPGVIVGQLQHRAEIGYSANRELLVKVRHVVTPVALTDGWGSSIDPRALR